MMKTVEPSRMGNVCQKERAQSITSCTAGQPSPGIGGSPGGASGVVLLLLGMALVASRRRPPMPTRSKPTVAFATQSGLVKRSTLPARGLEQRTSEQRLGQG